MLERRPLLQFLNSEKSAGLNALNGRALSDRVRRFSYDELRSFLQIDMATNEQAKWPHEGETVRRYGSAGLYVIAGGRR